MWLSRMHTKATTPGRIAWAAGESPAGGGARADFRPRRARVDRSRILACAYRQLIDRTVGGSPEAHHARGTLVCLYVWGLGRTWQALLSHP